MRRLMIGVVLGIAIAPPVRAAQAPEPSRDIVAIVEGMRVFTQALGVELRLLSRRACGWSGWPPRLPLQRQSAETGHTRHGRDDHRHQRDDRVVASLGRHDEGRLHDVSPWRGDSTAN